MAIAGKLPSQSKGAVWPSGTAQSNLQASSRLMTGHNQYQAPLPSNITMGMQQTTYMPGYPAQATSSADPRHQSNHSSLPLQHEHGLEDSVMPLVESRHSSSKPLKRSLSTPNVRQRGVTETENSHHSLSSEKKRNKLGYHRTSVACGHCRRRKIRCQPKPEDVQARCDNCIRLKKDCSFFPVDQQTTSGPGHKSGARSITGPKIASASSSPAISAGQTPDHTPQQSYPHVATNPALQSMGPPTVKSGLAEIYSVDAKLATHASSARGFDYGHHASGWVPADESPTAKVSQDISIPWRQYPQEPSVNSGYPSYPPHGQSSSASWQAGPLGASAGHDSASRSDEVAWSPYKASPSRSLSYTSEHAQQYPAMSQVGGPHSRAYRRSSTASDVYTPPISTPVQNIEGIAGTSINPHAPVSAPGYETWQHQQAYAYSKPSDGYGGWYNNGAGPSETQGSPHGTHATESSGMYYTGR